MELKRPYLMVFALLYLVVGISCLLVTISIATLEGKLNVQCGLFIAVKEEGVGFIYYSSTSHTTCQFLKWMPGLTFALSLILMAYHLYPAIARQPKFSVSTTVCWVIMIIIGILLFVAACIISVGFQKSCSEVSKMYRKKKMEFLSCKAMFDVTAFGKQGGPGDPEIYTFLSMAEISSWAAFLAAAVCVVILSLYWFWRPCRSTMTIRSS